MNDRSDTLLVHRMRRLARLMLVAALLPGAAHADLPGVRRAEATREIARMAMLTAHSQARQPATLQVSPTVFVPGQVLDFAGNVDSLQPGSTLHIAAPLSDCLLERAASAPITATANASGNARFAFKAWFADSAARPEKCRVGFTASGSDGGHAPFNLPYVFDFTPALPQVYVVNDTAQLLGRLKLVKVVSDGTCDGESGLKTEGGDIVFRVQRALLGNRCAWSSSATTLPNGVRLMRVDATVEGNAACRNGNEALLPTTTFWAGTSTDNPARAAGNVVAGANPNGAGAPVGVFGGQRITLACAAAALGSHQITVRLDSFTFTGPPGLPLSAIVQPPR